MHSNWFFFLSLFPSRRLMVEAFRTTSTLLWVPQDSGLGQWLLSMLFSPWQCFSLVWYQVDDFWCILQCALSRFSWEQSVGFSTGLVFASREVCAVDSLLPFGRHGQTNKVFAFESAPRLMVVRCTATRPVHWSCAGEVRLAVFVAGIAFGTIQACLGPLATESMFQSRIEGSAGSGSGSVEF